MTPREGAAAIRRKARALNRELKGALRTSADRGRQIGIMNSSGPYSYVLLALYGHPYSKRRPNSAFDPSLINVQSGRFRNAWRGSGAQAVGGGLRSRITNNAPYAEELIRQDRSGLNTVRRPIDRRVAAETRPYFVRYVTEAVRKAMQA